MLQRNTDDPDSALTEVLTTGLDDDEAFWRSRDRARELLDSDDIAGFWLQGIGDGSPVAGHDDPSERVTPHCVGHVAGYEDRLDDEGVGELAATLFAHHLGVKTNAQVAGFDTDVVLVDQIQRLTTGADAHLNALGEDAADQVSAVDFEAQRHRARRLLDADRLTTFWLQIVRKNPDQVVVTAGPQADADGRASRVETWATRPIEYVFGSLEAIDTTTHSQLFTQCLTQHLTVAALTSGREVPSLCATAAHRARRNGWVAHVPGSV